MGLAFAGITDVKVKGRTHGCHSGRVWGADEAQSNSRLCSGCAVKDTFRVKRYYPCHLRRRDYSDKQSLMRQERGSCAVDAGSSPGSECGEVGRAGSVRAPLELNHYFQWMSKPRFPAEGGDWCMFYESVSM